VILFNKWVLDTAGFRKTSPVCVSDGRVPDILNDMAFGVCDGHDTDPCANNTSPRRT
jgi:hypothetical protein